MERISLQEVKEKRGSWERRINVELKQAYNNSNNKESTIEIVGARIQIEWVKIPKEAVPEGVSGRGGNDGLQLHGIKQ